MCIQIGKRHRTPQTTKDVTRVQYLWQYKNLKRVHYFPKMAKEKKNKEEIIRKRKIHFYPRTVGE